MGRPNSLAAIRPINNRPKLINKRTLGESESDAKKERKYTQTAAAAVAYHRNLTFSRTSTANKVSEDKTCKNNEEEEEGKKCIKYVCVF